MPNRTLCSVLEEMRKTQETKDYSNLTSLIEESQRLFLNMVLSLYELR